MRSSSDHLLLFIAALLLILVFLQLLKFNVLFKLNNDQGAVNLQTGFDVSALPLTGAFQPPEPLAYTRSQGLNLFT